MDKMGTWLSPFNMRQWTAPAKEGLGNTSGTKVGASLHGIGDGVKFPSLGGGKQDLRLRSLDAGLVSPGGSYPQGMLNFTAQPDLHPATGGGWHFCLVL
jgi:hypothetical protein